MEKSALQIARAAYQPKLPKGLQGNVIVKEGAPTQSVADQEEIKKLFPNELADIETTSLARSLTSEPDKGHIKLDRPLHTDNYTFHF